MIPKSRRLREASLAQQLLLQTVEERRIKVQMLTDQAKRLESELLDAHTQGKCVPHQDDHAESHPNISCCTYFPVLQCVINVTRAAPPG